MESLKPLLPTREAGRQPDPLSSLTSQGSPLSKLALRPNPGPVSPDSQRHTASPGLGQESAPGRCRAAQEVEDALSATDWPPGPQRARCCKGAKWHHRGEGWTWDEAVSPGVRGQGPQNYAEWKLGGRVPASLRWKRGAVRRDGPGLSAELRPQGRTRWAGGGPACGRHRQAMGSRVSLPPGDPEWLLAAQGVELKAKAGVT